MRDRYSPPEKLNAQTFQDGRDIRPLSQRIRLNYVRDRKLADRYTRPLSLLLLVIVGGALIVMGAIGDEGIYSSGALTHAHAMFADDCTKCHVGADGSDASYFKPVSDKACLQCHVAGAHAPGQSMFAGGAHPVIPGHEPLEMAGDCAACHVEHRGADADLRFVSDDMCVRCHADLDAHGRAPARVASGGGGGAP